MTHQIGVIANSNSHIDYVCQLFGPMDQEQRPPPDAYAFGSFVAIALPPFPATSPATEQNAATGAPCLIGVVYNSMLVNPSFTNLGPRLTSHSEQAVFSPDLIDETAMLVGLLALGWQDETGPHQGTPRLSAEVGATVRRLTDEEVRQFHRDRNGRPALRYAATLLAHNSPLVPALLVQIIDRLDALFPEEKAILQVMRNNVAWKSIVQPAG
ncbi:MAG: hypothetical protein OXF54_10300 [Caldilineaceae bacterium]|nr:hypothetical protein [Caldilineaceae bacterium]